MLHVTAKIMLSYCNNIVPNYNIVITETERERERERGKGMTRYGTERC